MRNQTDDLLIELARERLPSPSAVEADYYRVMLIDNGVVPFTTSFPPKGESYYREVHFYKEYVSGIVIGWKVDSIK